MSGRQGGLAVRAWPAAPSRLRSTAMDYVIADLPAADLDQLQALWEELLSHHLDHVPHLGALAPPGTPAGSWRVRCGYYQRWLTAPRSAVLVARAPDRLLGYAMIRAVDDARSGQFGDQVGVLETLVVSRAARGSRVRRALLDAARQRLADWAVMMPADWPD